MANVAVVGVQWGDEGKGKIVDWLSERANVVVRFQGGHNGLNWLQWRLPFIKAISLMAAAPVCADTGMTG